MFWPKGTDSSTRTKDVVAKWIESYVKGKPNVSPTFFAIAPRIEKRNIPNAHVKIYTGYDDMEPLEWPLPDGNRIIEEFHVVTIDVIGEERAAGQDKLNTIVSLIRHGLADPLERQKLINDGVCNVRTSTDNLDVIDVVYNRPISLRCTTNTYV